MSRRSSKIFPRFIAAALAVPALAGAALLAAPVAFAETTETGPDGQELTVSQTALEPEGTKVTVSGTGFREDVGIYVALCVIPETGEAPGPCLGGVDMTGESGSSVWVATDPPAYAEGLTTPFEDGGSFEVEISVMADDGHTDCLDPAVAPEGCAISTRADHTRGSDRSADILIPVTFDGEAEENEEPAAEPTDEPTEEPSAEPTATETAAPEPSDDVQNDAATAETAEDDTDSFRNSTALVILIVAIVLGVVAGVTAVAFANRRKRQAARAAALERQADESDDAAEDQDGGDK